MRRALLPKESNIQSAFFQWLLYQHKDFRKVCFAIPNGGSRHAAEAVNLKRQGVTPGVPDVFCAIPFGGYHGLFIEFKSKNGKISEHQENMLDMLSNVGYKCVVCYSTDEGRKAFGEYLGLTQ